MGLHPLWRNRAAIAALLHFALLALAACAGPFETASAVHNRPENPPKASDFSGGAGKESQKGTAVETLLPEDVLSEEQLKNKKPPKYEDWYEEGSEK